MIEETHKSSRLQKKELCRKSLAQSHALCRETRARKSWRSTLEDEWIEKSTTSKHRLVNIRQRGFLSDFGPSSV
jgi:hypothetical protein